MPIASHKHRTPVKERRTVALLRDQIVQGRLARGSRLPRREELEQMFGVSSITLRRALNQLAADGFIYATPGQGTFVVDDPPHLTHYGLVFPSSPGQRWGNFFDALHREAICIQQTNATKLMIYYGMENPTSHEDRVRLIADVKAHRLAGLIFATPPFNYVGTPLLDEPGMARVAFAPFNDLPSLNFNCDSLVNKAIEYFLAKGRKRIAILSGAAMASELPSKFIAALSAHGLTTRSIWQQSISLGVPEAGKNLIELMCHSGQSARPDGLFIADDNLVPHATAGLVAAGIGVPDEIAVLAHCNFPHPTPSMVPANRIGFNCREILRRGIDLIDRQRRGESGPLIVDVAACFEDQLDARRENVLQSP